MFKILSSLFGFAQKRKLVLTAENHNEYYDKGTKLIEPYIIYSDKPSVNDNKAKVNIIEGIRYLDAVTEINQYNFAAFWLKGKGYQALEEHNSAYLEFKKAFQLNKDNPDIARELMLECVSLGNGNEAVEVALHAIALDSENSGLVANLALVYLINGDLDLSNRTIEKAIKLDPNDKINYNLKRIIDEVITGKRKRPMKYDDLNK